MSSEVRENLSRGSTWVRGLYLFQFVAHLLTGRPNARLREFGESLGSYLQEIADFLTYHSEQKPFPFAAWPGQKRLEGDIRREPEGHSGEGPGEKSGEKDSGKAADEGGDEPNESGVR